MTTTLELASRWLELDRDETTRKEISDLVNNNDEAELDLRLRTRIAFGTAGLRSSMKAGFAHMNSLTVLQASHGLADYVLQQSSTSSTPSVVIGYDARHNSSKFARLAAAAFLSKGFKVYWFGDYVHTPMVPFVVSEHGASVGVMVTASHNPKNDNGYKVYWSNGCQIIPPIDAGIAAAIAKVEGIDTWDASLVDKHSNVERVYKSATKAYLGSLRELVWPLSGVEFVMPFTYTPMHGVGLPFLRQIAHEMWFRGDNLRIVKAQADPDPEFSTVPFPNPEEKGALGLAIKEAERYGTSVILANDPDADRFAVATRTDTGWHQFSGNEMGVLLADFVLNNYKGDRSKMVMLASTVSSRMLAAMAKHEGFQFRETLTGFKWLGNVAQELKKQDLEPVFAYEEAIGYMFPSVVWDKDGIAAATVFLTAWQRWKRQNRTPYQKLQELYSVYGYFADANTYLISPSPETTNKVFKEVRTLSDGRPPTHVGKRIIRRWRDLTLGYDSAVSEGGKPELPVDPNTQMITCELDDVVFTVRGSGTEPKVKLYIEAKAGSHAEAKRIANEVLNDLLAEWLHTLRS